MFSSNWGPSRKPTPMKPSFTSFGAPLDTGIPDLSNNGNESLFPGPPLKSVSNNPPNKENFFSKCHPIVGAPLEPPKFDFNSKTDLPFKLHANPKSRGSRQPQMRVDKPRFHGRGDNDSSVRREIQSAILKSLKNISPDDAREMAEYLSTTVTLQAKNLARAVIEQDKSVGRYGPQPGMIQIPSQQWEQMIQMSFAREAQFNSLIKANEALIRRIKQLQGNEEYDSSEYEEEEEEEDEE